MPQPPRAVALVTGGASDIGQACLGRLSDESTVGVAAWRRTEPPAGPSVRFDTNDATQVRSAIDEVEDRWGPIETVVANAGVAHLGLAVRVSEARFREMVDTNLAGAFLVARTALGPMLRRRRGRIVFVGSVAGTWGVPGVTGYAASKAGLGGLARSLAREVGSRGVTVNVVEPGILDNAIDRIDANRPTSGVGRDWLAATPAGQAGTAADVAAAVAFLASDRAGFVTGATVPVDGGFTIGLG